VKVREEVTSNRVEKAVKVWPSEELQLALLQLGELGWVEICLLVPFPIL